MTHQLLATLKSAESFISGFEDDPLQEGIPTLLADLRAAIERTEPADPAEIEAARDGYQDDDLEIDDDALVSHADDGYWVSAWVWVAGDDDAEEAEVFPPNSIGAIADRNGGLP